MVKLLEELFLSGQLSLHIAVQTHGWGWPVRSQCLHVGVYSANECIAGNEMETVSCVAWLTQSIVQCMLFSAQITVKGGDRVQNMLKEDLYELNEPLPGYGPARSPVFV